MTPRRIALGGALALAAGLAFFGDKSPSGQVSEAVERRPDARAGASAKPAAPAAAVSTATTATTAATAKGASGAVAEPRIIALRPRASLVGEAGEAVFGAGEGPFLSQNFNPPPPPPPPPVVAPPPPPPSAPPLPFTYLGKAVGQGRWEVFLVRGDQTYIVRLDTVIDGTYRVDAIAPPVMTMTYLPLNQVQQLNIGVSD
ncbi:MAG: hypothetical protein V4754_08860 [Pseudomonadota bacterium]